MQLLDQLMEVETDLDWCGDPSDLERALAMRLSELEAHPELPAFVCDKSYELRLAQEIGRVTQH
jgi:hypothetical protein